MEDLQKAFQELDAKRIRLRDHECELLMEHMELNAQFLMLKIRLKKVMNSTTHPKNKTPQVRKPTKKGEFTELLIPIKEVFLCLQEKGQLQPVGSRPMSNPLPVNFNFNLFCQFHQATRHDTNN